MRKTLKSALALGLLATSMALPTMSTAEGDAPTKLQVTKVPFSFVFNERAVAPPPGDEGFLVDGTTYVPLRFMANAVEKSVRWDANTYTVYVTDPTAAETVAIREKSMNTETSKTGNASLSTSGSPQTVQTTTIAVYKKPIRYVFNGEERTAPADKSGLLYNNRVYIPLRFFGEATGQSVHWDPVSFSISVRSASVSHISGTPAPNVTPSAPAPTDALPERIPSSSGGGGGGGGGGGSQSYDDIIAETESKIEALRNRCEGQLSSLFDEFLEADDLEEQLELVAEGEQILASCDNSFERIMDSLRDKLQDGGYDTDVIEEYEDAYERLKQEEMDRLLSQL